MSISYLDPTTAPGPILVRVMRELGYFPELPTSVGMFYGEWDRLNIAERLDMLKYAGDLMYG